LASAASWALLKGDRREVPVMRTTMFELVINLQTARLLGISTWLL
jgi:hypothetical protein